MRGRLPRCLRRPAGCSWAPSPDVLARRGRRRPGRRQGDPAHQLAVLRLALDLLARHRQGLLREGRHRPHGQAGQRLSATPCAWSPTATATSPTARPSTMLNLAAQGAPGDRGRDHRRAGHRRRPGQPGLRHQDVQGPRGQEGADHRRRRRQHAVPGGRRQRRRRRRARSQLTNVAESALVSSYLQGLAPAMLGGMDDKPAEIKANGGKPPVILNYGDPRLPAGLRHRRQQGDGARRTPTWCAASSRRRCRRSRRPRPTRTSRSRR